MSTLVPISTLQAALGGAMLVAAILYALLGGADFGGGVMDALARGPRRREQRALIERAIGPIWEANHVWLIVVVVLLFTGFPAAFAAISISLFVPLTLLLVGIVLRGAAFTFRAYGSTSDASHARLSAVFSTSSALAPLMLGTIAGTIASGRLRLTGGVPDDGFFRPWVAPFPLSVGLFTVALFALLAAVYLTVEADGELREDFRTRAIGAGVAVFALALLTIILAALEAPIIFAGLTTSNWALPLHAATGVAAIVAFLGLVLRRFRLARLAVDVQVALILIGWGAAQYPYLVVPSLTLASATGAAATQRVVLWALVIGGLLLFPALYLLFRVFKGERPFSLIDQRPPGAAGVASDGGRSRQP